MKLWHFIFTSRVCLLILNHHTMFYILMLSWELRFALNNCIFWLSILVLHIDLKIKKEYVIVCISGTMKYLWSCTFFHVLFRNALKCSFFLIKHSFLFIYFNYPNKREIISFILNQEHFLNHLYNISAKGSKLVCDNTRCCTNNKVETAPGEKEDLKKRAYKKQEGPSYFLICLTFSIIKCVTVTPNQLRFWGE